MPRNMSFMLTTQQIVDQTKTVTRRLGWDFLKPGDVLNACEKCQGMRKGHKIVRLGQIRVISTAWEPLRNITYEECVREGFPDMAPEDFVTFFCEHNNCAPNTYVNRIAFEYCKPKCDIIRS